MPRLSFGNSLHHLDNFSALFCPYVSGTTDASYLPRIKNLFLFQSVIPKVTGNRLPNARS